MTGLVLGFSRMAGLVFFGRGGRKLRLRIHKWYGFVHLALTGPSRGNANASMLWLAGWLDEVIPTYLACCGVLVSDLHTLDDKVFSPPSLSLLHFSFCDNEGGFLQISTCCFVSHVAAGLLSRFPFPFFPSSPSPPPFFLSGREGRVCRAAASGVLDGWLADCAEQ